METGSTSDSRTELLELYKLHAELADRVSQRRETANCVYLILLTAIFALLAALARLGEGAVADWVVTAGCVLGVALSVSWFIVIRSYRQLNTGKFAALLELEEKLAYPFFRREWEILERGENIRRYWKLTVVETALPIIFGALFLADISVPPSVYDSVGVTPAPDFTTSTLIEVRDA